MNGEGMFELGTVAGGNLVAKFSVKESGIGSMLTVEQIAEDAIKSPVDVAVVKGSYLVLFHPDCKIMHAEIAMKRLGFSKGVLSGDARHYWPEQ